MRTQFLCTDMSIPCASLSSLSYKAFVLECLHRISQGHVNELEINSNVSDMEVFLNEEWKLCLVNKCVSVYVIERKILGVLNSSTSECDSGAIRNEPCETFANGRRSPTRKSKRQRYDSDSD